MPQHKQFEKAIRQNEKARVRNRAAKARVKTFEKKVTVATTKEDAQTAFRRACSIIDSTARKGIIHKKLASRKKSQLSRLVAKLEG